MMHNSLSSTTIILPITPPPSEPTTGPLPSTGYTILHNVEIDTKAIIIRRENGFERRTMHRCQRCLLSLGYEVMEMTEFEDATNMDIDDGRDRDVDGKYKGMILYVLPVALMDCETGEDATKLPNVQIVPPEKGPVIGDNPTYCKRKEQN
jgi:hypothetical protein